MLLVIRCPRCRAAARVDEPDLGLTVQCPRCADTFTAIEEAELIAPGPKSAPGAELADRPDDTRPDDTPPPRPRRPPPEPPRDGAEAGEQRPPATDHDAQFDPHAEPPGSLPASVLVGLALLPFLIPILWVIAPIVVGQEPVLSLASALALAVSASVLCLAVIYTVDWRPGTRIKGVLLLVVLSYVTGVGLYLLKKEFVDRVRKFFGVHPVWTLFQPGGAGYQVRLPGAPAPVVAQKDLPLRLATLACHKVTQNSIGIAGVDVFVVGSGPARPPENPNAPPPGTDAWFDAVAADIAARAGGTIESTTVKTRGVAPGRQITIAIGNDGLARVAEVYYLPRKNWVYYAAVEGPSMRADDSTAQKFFESFLITDAGQ